MPGSQSTWNVSKLSTKCKCPEYFRLFCFQIDLASVKYPGGIIVLPYRENKDDIKSHANGYHKSQESNMSLDIRYHSQNGPSHNSLRPQYFGNARIFDQTGLSLLNDTFWKTVWQDGTLVPRNIHARLIYSACGFFGTYTMYTRVYRGPREPLDPETRKIFKLVTNFTIEIQLEILEFLPLHRGDLEVRLHYPHLIPMWIKTIPVRYHRYITRLLSIDNLCLLGRYYWDDEDDGHKFYGNGVDVYRFVSLNYHPEETSRIHNQLATLRNMNGNDTNTEVVPQGNEPFWDDASKTLRQHLIRLFINDKENNLRESESDVRGRRSDQDIVPISCSREYWNELSTKGQSFCYTCSLRLPARPFLIPLSFSMSVFRRGQRKTPDQYLLIFNDELAEIFRNMEVAYRPVFWRNSFQRSLRRDTESENVFVEWMLCGCHIVRLGDNKHVR